MDKAGENGWMGPRTRGKCDRQQNTHVHTHEKEKAFETEKLKCLTSWQVIVRHINVGQVYKFVQVGCVLKVTLWKRPHVSFTSPTTHTHTHTHNVRLKQQRQQHRHKREPAILTPVLDRLSVVRFTILSRTLQVEKSTKLVQTSPRIITHHQGQTS